MKKNSSLLIHEWVTPNGGSEKVTIAISSIFKKKPDLFVLWDEKSELDFSGQSWIANFAWLPKSARAAVSFLAHLTWRGEYELVISSSHLYAHGARVAGSRKSPKIAYIHTPARYIWEPKIDNRFNSRINKLLQAFSSQILKKIDLLMLSQGTHYIANSTFVRDRIKQHWGRESTVIHPPVKVEYFNTFFQGTSPKELTLISAGRLVKYKRHDLTIRVASEMKCKAIIAGTGPEENFLKELAKELNVEVDFYHMPTDEKFAELLSKSSVFLNSGIEDFGIVPIEAIATGTPVVGLDQGGLIDTVSSQNGILVHSHEEFPDAVLKALELNRHSVMKTSMRFSEEEFKKTFAEFLIEKVPSCIELIKDDFKSKS
jgi:glycosyltransferase involved in cell wall biosynthesis